MIGTGRPLFKTVDEYIHHVDEALSSGREPWAPVTVDELVAVVERSPDYARRWLPGPRERRLTGLPAYLGREVERFGEVFQERFLATLEADAEFRDALNHVLSGGAGR